jgi:large subunit ribosomal protein L18
MSEFTNKLLNKKLRHSRVRSRIIGTAERPRLSVSISNRHVNAQIINDAEGKTLAASTSVGAKKDDLSISNKAAFVGADIAKKAKKAKVTTVSFDRGSRRYAKRLQSLADAARAEGLEF